jgi:hypothetical protein
MRVASCRVKIISTLGFTVLRWNKTMFTPPAFLSARGALTFCFAAFGAAAAAAAPSS